MSNPRGRIPEPVETRFWRKVNKTETCWLWTGSTTDGYGMIGTENSRAVRGAHRVSWELAHGPIPAGLCVLHRCDVRACVRPDHLFLGTRDDNMRDRNQKGRQAQHERHGKARLSAEEVAEIRKKSAAGATQRALASSYGVGKGTIQHIVSDKTWV